MAHPPAGWHPDPLSRHAQRYWDGTQWTEHVADQSGNMSTDPLDGGQSATQQNESTDQGGWGQSDSGTTSDATADAGSSWGSSGDQATAATDTSSDTGSSWASGTDQAAATDTTDTTAGGGGDTATSSGSDQPESTSWGGTTDRDSATADTASGTADTDTGEDLPSWQSSDTRDADATAEWSQPTDTTPADTTAADTAEATDEPAWGAGAGAAGAAAAAGSVAASDADRSAPVDDRPGTGDSIEHVETGSTPASDADVSHPTIAVVTVGTGVVVRNDHVVAASSGLSMANSDHPGATSITGDGTVHVGADGREITVLDVPASGLTIADDALVAHSAGLTRAAAADGIVGYDGTSVTGGGWVAIAAVGGALKVSPVGGVDVTPAALVAWSSDLDVSHAENVNLSGRGTVLVSAVTG